MVERLCPLCRSGLHIRVRTTFQKIAKGPNCAPNMSTWDCGSRQIDGHEIIPGWKCRARVAEAEVERLREHEKWLKLGHEAADGFLDVPSRSHIADKVCIIGWERDELREEKKDCDAFVKAVKKYVELRHKAEQSTPEQWKKHEANWQKVVRQAEALAKESEASDA